MADRENPPSPRGTARCHNVSQPEPTSPRSSATPRISRAETYRTSSPLMPRHDSGSSPLSSDPGSQFAPLNSETTDRVFPIRSVVSVDPTPPPPVRSEGPEFFNFSSREPSPNSQQTTGRRFSITGAPSIDQLTSSDPPVGSQRAAESISTGSNYASSRSEAGRDSSNEPDQPIRAGNKAEPTAQHTRAASKDPRTSQPSETTSNVSQPTSAYQGVGEQGEAGGPIITARFKHVVTTEGHAVITGRDGSTLQRCEDEPIHIPGAVQGFGLLIALREGSDGRFQVRIVSENSQRMIGYTPNDLFGLDDFCDILSEEQAENMLDHVDFVRDEEADPGTNGPEVFTISLRPPRRRSIKLWCAMHINKANPDLVICEFEMEDDQLFPLVPKGEMTPELPEDTLSSIPTQEQLAESTDNPSRPLRVLKSGRKRKGEAAAMEVFNIMSQVQEQLASAPTLDKFLKILVGVIKELTGFHRVMVYQFDQSWNGRVVTELVDYRATRDLYKGLHFPASDIPKQARDLYKVNKVRLLYDRDQETARLVCRSTEDLATPLDLTYSYLRAMSPIHIQYLANMAVRASMSISINAFDELWGLISCHAYGAKGMRVSFPVRKMCRLIGDSASRNIERLSYASRLQARKLINTASTTQNPSGYIVASSDDLLQLFGADFGLLSIRDETKILGRLEQSQEALAMLEYLRLRKVTSVLTSQALKEDFPDLRYQPGFRVIAGLLAVPLSAEGDDFIVFFRKGQLKEVKWAGNPYEKVIKEGTEGYLEPRKSFRTWSEKVVGKCKEWTEEEIETAAVLCLVYGKFINVWRQKEAALQSSQLTRLLIANSAHEVRTPLNAIINYLEIALEGSIDSETRENLAKSHSASKSLIYVINDLLDLTKTEEGHDLVKGEVFDLPATVREATDMFKGDAKRKGIEYELIEHPGFPTLVVGDQRRVQQAVSNVTANAIQNTASGGVKVELWLANAEERRVEVDIVIQDTGAGMSSTQLDELFSDLEQVQSEGDGIADTLCNDSPQPSQNIKGSAKIEQGKRTLGLGLAVVARVVRNMDGQLRLKSEEGEGSRFVIQLPFDLPPSQDALDSKHTPNLSMPPGPMTPAATEGEVMLVANVNSHKPSSRQSTVARKQSVESMNSLNSFESAKSDVDRLIDAISEPHMVGKGQGKDRPPLSSGKRERQGSLSAPRPAQPSRSLSYGGGGLATTAEHLRSPAHVKPGEDVITDSKTPLKSIRVPEDIGDTKTNDKPPSTSRILFEVADKSSKQAAAPQPSPPRADHLRVLIAEDDPVNSKIVEKRLEKIGHAVQLTVNGEECASMYGEKAGLFDVVLMDMQVRDPSGMPTRRATFLLSSPDANRRRPHLDEDDPVI